VNSNSRKQQECDVGGEEKHLSAERGSKVRTNHITDATKIMILAAATLITCILVMLGFSAMRTAKNLNETAIAQMISLNNDLKDSDIMRFDHCEVYGSDVVNIIRKKLGDYGAEETAPIYIYVKTMTKENTYTDGAQIKSLQNFTHENYIKPTAMFYGELDINENDVILGIRFQQK